MWQNRMSAPVEGAEAGVVSLDAECVKCNKRAYLNERVSVDGAVYHKQCFRCSAPECGRLLTPGTYVDVCTSLPPLCSSPSLSLSLSLFLFSSLLSLASLISHLISSLSFSLSLSLSLFLSFFLSCFFISSPLLFFSPPYPVCTNRLCKQFSAFWMVFY